MIGHRIKGLTDVASAHYQRTNKGRQKKKVQDSDGSEL